MSEEYQRRDRKFLSFLNCVVPITTHDPTERMVETFKTDFETIKRLYHDICALKY